VKALVNNASNRVEHPRGEQILALVADSLARSMGEAIAAGSTIDTDRILTTVTKAIAGRLPVSCMAILLQSDPDKSRVHLADDRYPAWVTWVEDYITTLLRPHEAPTTGLSRHVIESGVPYFFPRMTLASLASLGSEEGRQYAAAHPMPAPADEVGLLMVPMRSGPAVVGTLAIFDWGCTQVLGDADLDWMQRAADRVGLAIENAQMRNHAVQRLERIATLSEVAMAIASGQDMRVTFKFILERTMATLRVDAADIVLVDETEDVLFVAASAGFRSAHNAEVRSHVPSDAGKQWVIEHNIGSTAAIEWIGQSRRWMLAREGLLSYTAAPLTVREKFVGALEVFSRAALEPDTEWLSFLDAMASQAAIAYDSSTMFEALRKRGGRAPAHRVPPPDLSDRELQILALLVQGASNREVAEKLHLSQNTIKFHVRQLLEKAEVANRTELASRAVHGEWV
jgi:DNA-binding CsgD family transcriptional regulator